MPCFVLSVLYVLVIAWHSYSLFYIELEESQHLNMVLWDLTLQEKQSFHGLDVAWMHITV